jgi:hypothetical protein
MIKKIVVTALIIVVLGAVSIGVYDAAQGNSSLNLSSLNPLQSNPAWAQGQGQGQAGAVGPGQGRGQGRGQGQGLSQGQGQGTAQGQGQGPAQGQGRGQGRGQGQGQGNGTGVPQQHDWLTLQGTVISFDQQGLVVDTVEQGQLTLAVGPVWFNGQQEITFNPGDAVTIQGFVGEQGTFVAGQITNDTTGQTLLLRDPNGRPLWAGRGQGGQP